MTGAIEFLKAWRDVCKEAVFCNKCPVKKYCQGMVVESLSDKDITELVRSVMAQSRKGGKMEAKIKHDMEFFYKFMKARGYYEMDVYYFWKVFISGRDYHKDPNLSKDEIEDIDVFDRVYGEDYEKENK